MKKLSKGFTLVELLVVISILGVLMVMLVPKLMGGAEQAKYKQMEKGGSDLIKAIIGKNAILMLEGEDLWAHESENDGKGSDEDRICGKTFGTSTEYFKELFDIEHQTSSEWAPEIDKGLLSLLWGNGVPAARSGQLTKANVAWTMVSGMPDSADSKIPVLVTRNVDTSNFAKSGTQTMETTTPLAIDKYAAPFGKKAAIIVYKDGSSRTLEGGQATLKNVYKDMPTVSFANGITLKYLEP